MLMTLLKDYFIEHISNCETTIKITETSLEETVEKLEIKDFDILSLTDYINDAIKILKIDTPQIKLLPYIYLYQNHFILSDDWMNFGKGYKPVTGIYADFANLIIISRYNLLSGQSFEDYEILYSAYYMLRIVWQQRTKGNNNICWNKPEIEEIEAENSKIDADSFAMAAISCFTKMGHQYNRMTIPYLSHHNGRRITRAKEIEQLQRTR